MVFIRLMNIRNFDLNLLLIFDALMRERNVSRVADQLALSQPAISNALNRLRLLLNDQLFVRTAQGMQPTTIALELEQPIREALHQIDLSLNRGGTFDPATSTLSFTFALTDYVEFSVMPGLIAHIGTVAPGIAIAVTDLGPELAPEELDAGKIDIAIGRFPKLPVRARQLPWLEETLVLAASKDNPRITPSLGLDDFLALNHLWVSGGQRKGMVDTWLDSQGLSRNITYTTPNYMLAPHLVAGSDLVVVLPRRFAEQHATMLPLQLQPLPIPLPPFQLDLVWSSLREQDQALQWMLQEVSRWLKRWQSPE